MRVLFCLESINGRNQLALSSFQNFDHKCLVSQIFDINLCSIASVCLTYYLHLVDLRVLLGLGDIIKIGSRGFDFISLGNIIQIGCLGKVLVLLW